MKTDIIRILSVVLFILLLAAPLCVCAEQGCILTLTYTKDEAVFSDIDVYIYRIADTAFNKTESFDGYSVQVKNVSSQTEWNEIAVTLSGYIQADALEPYMTGRTDSEGKVMFGGLEKGLYLVFGTRIEREDSIYDFYDFMIFVDEDINAKPKAVVDKTEDGEKTYTILKLWKNDKADRRPALVTVDILKDGVLQETVKLDRENDWSYTFVTDSDSIWTVVERQVPDHYYVTVTEKETVFIITNTLLDDGEYPPDTPPTDDSSDADTLTPPGTDVPGLPGKDSSGEYGDKPGDNQNAPQTGDTFPMKRYMIMLCVSGMMFVVLGIGIRRNGDAKSR
ncbi:MAG: Cna B-type domain-containing protein [Clostridia bacterium]|nr:Cna B-type domain-containing protein [Clostridia bacterium]